MSVPFSVRCFVVALCVISLGCSTGSSVTARSKRPLKEVSANRWPVLADDLPVESLLAACDHSLSYLERVPPERVFSFGPLDRSAAQLADGVRRFREIMQTEGDPALRTRLLQEDFILLRSVGRNRRGEVLFTGYYEPLLDARLEEEPGYTVPVRASPTISSRSTCAISDSIQPHEVW